MIIDIDTASAAQAAVLAQPGVAAMHPGRYGEVALLYPKERVVGFKRLQRDGREGLEVHVVVDMDAGINIYDVADTVRETVRDATAVELIDVTIADVSSALDVGSDNHEEL